MPERPVVTAPPVPEVVAPKPAASAEVIQWLAQVEAQHTAQYQSEAAGPFEKAVAALRAQYLAQLDRGSDAATKAGKLDDTLAWRNEQARLSAGQQPHDAPDEPTEPAALRQLRENWRKAFAKFDAERFAKAKLVQQRLDALLERGQTGYTQKGRLDDALLLKTKREAIRTAWLTPPVDFSKPAAPAATPKPLGTAMDTPKPNAGTLTGREAVEYLYGLGLETVFTGNDGKVGNIGFNSKPEELPKGHVEITLIRAGRRRDELPISDDVFKKLGPQRKLSSFGVAYANLTGTGLAFLAGCHDLVSVEVDSSGLTDAVLEPLLGLRKLETLQLTGFTPPLAWTRLGELSALPNLTTFYTHHAEGIPPAVLARARRLQSLTLNYSQLTEEHFAAIGNLPDLVTFTLGDQGEPGAAGLRHLEKCTKLTELRLFHCTGVGPHLGFIGKMRKLTVLALDGADAPSLAAAAGAPALRTINLEGAAGSSVTADGIRALAKLPKLKSFTWGKRPLPVELATELAALPVMESLVISDCGIDETQLRELAKSKTLTKLDATHQKLTPAAIEVLKGMRGLRDLFVYDCGLTPADVAALRKALPRCSVKN